MEIIALINVLVSILTRRLSDPKYAMAATLVRDSIQSLTQLRGQIQQALLQSNELTPELEAAVTKATEDFFASDAADPNLNR